MTTWTCDGLGVGGTKQSDETEPETLAHDTLDPGT